MCGWSIRPDPMEGWAALGCNGTEPRGSPTTPESIWVRPTALHRMLFFSLPQRGDLQRGRGPQSSPSTAEVGVNLNQLQSEALPEQRSGAPDWEVGEGGTIFKLSCILFCICLCSLRSSSARAKATAAFFCSRFIVIT